MSKSILRVGVGTRVIYDGELLEVAELHAGPSGTETVLRSCRGQGGIVRVTLQELLTSRRASLIADTAGVAAEDAGDPADVVLSAISETERAIVAERAAHVREVFTGYRSGTAELAAPDEPRPQYDMRLTLTARYEAKAAELGVSLRTITQWVADFRQHGEAGLARSAASRQKPLGLVDERWVESALEVMVEHTEQSRPSLEMPLSEDALRFARKQAAAKYTYPDDRVAVADLLERWNLGLGSTLAERRMALRLSREEALIGETEVRDEVATLPSVARVLATADPPAAEDADEMSEEPAPETGDDDADEDLDDYAAADFYADALEDA